MVCVRSEVMLCEWAREWVAEHPGMDGAAVESGELGWRRVEVEVGP